MFNPPLAESDIPTFAQISTTNTAWPLVQRARSFLDVNCAFCHRPNGVSQAAWDGRWNTPITNQSIVNAAVFNALGISGARVIRSGSIPQSVMRVRLNTRDANAMPPLDKTLVDTNAVALFDSWILSLTNAPSFQTGSDTNGSFLLVHGQPGINYTLQSTSNFSSWSNRSTMFNAGTRAFAADEASAPIQFYRLQLPP
jgi:hypothetical protein